VDMTHITVPSVEDLSVPDATSTLSSDHLTVGTVSESFSATVPEGAVVSQSPSAGAVAHRTVKIGPPVDLVVSNGPPPTRRLTVLRSGLGSGNVSSQPSGMSCGSACSHSFAFGTEVVLSAKPAVGSRFVGWSGACSGTDVCTVTMNQARTVTATFKRASVKLTVSKAGVGSGKIVSTPIGISCGFTCIHAFGLGATVVLKATPVTGSKFAGWSGACSGTGVCKVTLTAAASVTATFTKN